MCLVPGSDVQGHMACDGNKTTNGKKTHSGDTETGDKEEDTRGIAPT